MMRTTQLRHAHVMTQLIKHIRITIKDTPLLKRFLMTTNVPIILNASKQTQQLKKNTRLLKTKGLNGPLGVASILNLQAKLGICLRYFVNKPNVFNAQCTFFLRGAANDRTTQTFEVVVRYLWIRCPQHRQDETPKIHDPGISMNYNG